MKEKRKDNVERNGHNGWNDEKKKEIKCGRMKMRIKKKSNTRVNECGEWKRKRERASDGEGEIGRSAERADRRLLWATVKPSMPLAFDNYSRSVLHNVTKYERVVVCIDTRPSFATHCYKFFYGYYLEIPRNV